MTRFAFVLGLLLACGGGTDDTEVTEVGSAGDEIEAPAPPPSDPLALMPADAVSVTTFDVPRLRTSPYYSTVRGWLEVFDELTPSQRQAIDSAVGNTDLAHVSVVPCPSSTCWTLASIYLGTTMDSRTANATLHQLAERETFAPREVAGHPAFGNAQGALVEVEPTKYLVGPTEHIEPALMQPQRPRAESDAAVAAAVDALAGGEGSVRGWVVGNATTQAQLARETPFSSRLIALVRGAAYRAEVSNGLVLDLVATAADAASAATLGDGLRREIDALTSGLPARAMGISVLGEATTIRVSGNQAHLTLQLDDAQLRSLLRRADGLIRLVN